MSTRSIEILAVAALASCSSPPAPTLQPMTMEAGSGGGGPGCLLEVPSVEPQSGPCSGVFCGNTARIYGDVIEALDERGKEVQDLAEPFRLVRESLTGAKGKCAGVAKLSLGVRDGGFVGLAGPLDTVKCSGNELVGARFKVEQRRKPPKNQRFATVRINAMADVAVWQHEPQEPVRIPTYDLVTETGPVLPIEKHLCPESVWNSSLINLPFDKSARTQHAILLQGESYGPAATVVHDGASGARWFNIGCAGTGIAKLRLLGFDPIRKPAATGERQATLKMITAKYCGARSWTREGTVLLFVDQNASSAGPPLPLPSGGSGAASIGPIETRWGPDGALCISHSRLWSVGSKCEKESETAFVERIRSECNIPACDETAPCESNAATSDGIWRTCTVNHVRHGL